MKWIITKLKSSVTLFYFNNPSASKCNSTLPNYQPFNVSKAPSESFLCLWTWNKFSDCSGSIIVWPCCPVCGRICWFAALLCNNTNNTTPETADKAPRHTVTRHSPLGKIVDLSELVWSQWGWAALDTGHRREVWSVPPARGRGQLLAATAIQPPLAILFHSFSHRHLVP